MCYSSCPYFWFNPGTDDGECRKRRGQQCPENSEEDREEDGFPVGSYKSDFFDEDEE